MVSRDASSSNDIAQQGRQIPMRRQKPAKDWRTTGSAEPSAWCLSDVLAGLGASILTNSVCGWRIDDIGENTFPTITRDQAEGCLALLRERADLGATMLDRSAIDLFRGAGQMGLLSERIKALPSRVSADDITAWAEARSQPLVSLRLETCHVSDVPAAYRWSGSSPVNRLSHGGRSALAALALLTLEPPSLASFRCDIAWLADRTKPTGVVGTIAWPVCLRPMSWAAWIDILVSRQQSYPHIAWLTHRVAAASMVVKMECAHPEMTWGVDGFAQQT